MADLAKLQEFAAAHGFGLTRPLSHAQVVRLAEYWLPEMRFHPEEKFHPVALDELVSMVVELFARLPASAQAEWRVNTLVRGGAHPSPVEGRASDPPVVYVPDGLVGLVPVVRVLGDGSSARDALSDPAVGGDAVITHGASFTRADQFFGATGTLSGGAQPATGDPFVPRATGADGRPVVTVVASLLNLLELLKYELTVSAAGVDYPPDALRGAFLVGGMLVRSTSATPLPPPALRQYLLALIASHESNGAIPPPALPAGWTLDRRAWDAVTRYAFLEYEFFYAYNDFERYQTAIFDNEHEGDNEGCCLVFDRNVLNLAAAAADPDALLRAVPHSIIASVHEEFQDADVFKFVAPPLPTPGNLARDDVPLTVYVAGGSHATYLTGGVHDLVDFGDYTGYVEENPAVLLLAALGSNLLAPALILLGILEHLVDTEDFTSDDGVRAGPAAVVGGHPAAVASRLVVLPMSADNHVYQPGNEDLLRLRSYPGKWGAHNGAVDKSPAFTPKTGRYFRQLIRQLSG